MQRLSGQRTTPVLVLDGEVIPGSARILAALEQRYPERPLLPEDPKLAERALALEAPLRRRGRAGGAHGRLLGADPRAGPAVPDVLAGQAGRSSALYRAAFPLTGPLIGRANGVIDPAGVERAFAKSEAALEQVARELGPSGQLAGDRFSLADLACAALLAPLVSPDHPDMSQPRPRPAAMEAFLARFASHPSAAWVREQYRKHRPAPCVVAG